MKKNLLLIILIYVSVVACQSIPGDPKSSLRDCPPGSVERSVVRLTAPQAAITAAPPHICVAPGTDITVRITNSPGKGKVATQAQDDANTWLNGSNSVNADDFVLHVPGDAGLDTYKYNVLWSGKPKLDPRVSVRTEDRD